MLKLPLTYTNFNGDVVTKDFFFNLSKAELAEQEMTSDGTFSKSLIRIGESKKGSEILPEFKKILKWSYGVKSQDGERFIKTDEVWEQFQDSAAYEVLIMKLFTEEGFAAYFANGIVPADVSGQLKEQNAVPGFRPGADTSRPTPPVIGQQQFQAPIVPTTPQEPAWPNPAQNPNEYTEGYAPQQNVVPLQHESAPRQTPYDQPNQQ
jgi:hypothetical protein